MCNTTNESVFIQSTLKVTASSDINIDQDLNSPDNKSIDILLAENNEEKKE